MFVHMNFDAPLREIILALKDIRGGNFDRKVPVRSNDEIGYTGDVINEMTKGLKERDRLRHSLLLAKEIQQFGKARFKDVIQTHAAESAAGILTRVIHEVDGFAGNSKKSDDVTIDS